MPDVNVQIQTTSGGIHKVTVNPERLRLRNGQNGLVITWRARGQTTFLPGRDAFDWLDDDRRAPRVTRVDDTTLRSDPFDNDFGGASVIWRYLIGVEKNGVKIQVDPEVDNDPPLGPG
jgi:hypothetical protein